MSYRKLLLKTGIASALTLTMVTGMAAASPTATVNASTLRLRSAPDTNSSTLVYVPRNTQVSILEQLEGWYKVDHAGMLGYMSADYLLLEASGSSGELAAPTGNGEETGEVEADAASFVKVNIHSGWLNVRSGPSTAHDRVGTMQDGSVATVISEENGWFQITDGTVTGYVSGEYVYSITEEEAIAAGDSSIDAIGSASGQAVVDLAMQYRGAPYVYGAAGPRSFDCSGLTMYIFKQFGYSLPHTATGQLGYGQQVSRSELQPGDLVFFRDPSISKKAASHVGIYIGDGQFIHASSSRNNSRSVIVSSLSSSYYNRYYTTGRRLVQ